MRLGTDSIGRWGLVILVVTGVLGGVLAVHGWSTRSAALPKVTLGNSRSANSTPTTTPRTQGPTAPSQSHSDGHRPLLSAQSYANVAYQIWPGTPSAAAKAALIGLNVSVKRQGSALVVTAGVNGQAAQSPRTYAGGARVYVIEASLGDDSGSTDYNLGDDALVVTDTKGGIIQ